MSTSLIHLNEIPKTLDSRGALFVADQGAALPFVVRRAYWIQGVPIGVSRGFHAHKKLKQLFICIQGSVKITLFDGKVEESLCLNTPNKGLIVGPSLWREMSDFSADCILLVLADAEYDEADYIRSKQDFIRHVHSSAI
jgi:dTDP-4-dehydrorhamnose 3,5-epimerase